MRGRSLLAGLIGLALCGPLWAVMAVPSPQGAASPIDLSIYARKTEVPGLSPVQSVNALTGAVALPTYQRQVSSAVAVSTADGTVTWTFPTAFTNSPTCWPSLAATSTTYTFDYPQVTSISRTAVSLLVTAHPKSMTVTSLTLPIVLQFTPAGPPAGTTITFSCLAPL